MKVPKKRLMIMVSGPYTHGSNDPELWKRNLEVMNNIAFEVFQKGHIPVISVNAALPIIAAAGNSFFDDLMMPISLALADRCDAVLRIGGSSTGADLEV